MSRYPPLRSSIDLSPMRHALQDNHVPRAHDQYNRAPIALPNASPIPPRRATATPRGVQRMVLGRKRLGLADQRSAITPFGIPCRRNAGRAGLFIDRNGNHATPAVAKPMILRPMASRPWADRLCSRPCRRITQPRLRQPGPGRPARRCGRGARPRRAVAAVAPARGGVARSVAEGSFGAGARLPSTRELAAELGLARSTVVAVFEQLAAEGYIAAQPGSGYFVPAPPAMPPPAASAARPARRRAPRSISRRGGGCSAT